MSWVETTVPCMIYCGDDLCNCSARWFHEALEEEEEDWSIADKKGLVVKRAYEKYLKRLREYHSNAYPALAVGLSKEICMCQGSETLSVLR